MAESLSQRIRRHRPETIAAVMTQRARAQAELDAQHPDPLAGPIAASLLRSTVRLIDRGLVAAPVEDAPAVTAPSRAAARANRPAVDDLDDDPGDANSPPEPPTMDEELGRMDLPDLLELQQEIRSDQTLPKGQRAHLLYRVGDAIGVAEQEAHEFERFKAEQADDQRPTLTPSDVEPVDELDREDEYGLEDGDVW